jgi:Zn-dependent M28 family amino/carboxypeptidase
VLRKPLRIALLPLCAALLGARAPVPSGSPEIAVAPERLRSHMEVLAADLLEGREAGTRGDALAQLYLASRFREIGLQPAGDAGTYLQRFRVRATTLEPESVDFRVAGHRFPNGEDVAVFGDPLEADQRVEAEAVFAGYGIVAPERGIDDYRGLDVRGKVVALLGGPPAFLPAAEAAHYGSTEQQRATAEAKGAIGVVILWTPALEQRFPFNGLKPLLARTDLNWLAPDGTPHQPAPKVRLRAFTRGAATDALLARSGRSFAALLKEAKTRSPKAFALRTRVSLARRSRHDDSLSTANVAALLPGSDPRLRDELVVLTAHFDHVGVGPPVQGDSIYNGALDNAVGTAMLLEVARAIVAAPQRPKRSILFLAVAAEEKGLIGSDYFASRPTVPGATIVADINLDGAMPFYDFSDVIAFGAEQSQMGERLAAAAGELGLSVAPDPFPEEGIFTRSDQYSFVKGGVPSLFLYMGFHDMEGRNVGRGLWDKLNETIVHQPGDDLSQAIDYAVAAKFADVFRRVTLETANAPQRPLWYRGSVFGQRFAPGSPKPDPPRAHQGSGSPR